MGRLSLANMFEQCQVLVSRKWEARVVHIYKECNRVANCLESKGLKLARGLHGLEAPPPYVTRVLLYDDLCTTWPRRVPLN